MFFLSYRDKNWEGPFLRMFLESPTSIFIPSSVSEDFLYPFVIVALAVVEGCFEKIQFFIIQYYNSNQHTDCNRFVKTTHFIRSCIESFFGLAHRHSTHQNRNIALKIIQKTVGILSRVAQPFEFRSIGKGRSDQKTRRSFRTREKNEIHVH